MMKQASTPTISFLDRLGVHTLNGYDVRNQVIQLVRYHLKPGEFYKAESKNPVGDGAFRRLAERSSRTCYTESQKPTALDEIPIGCQPNSAFGSEAQEWFIQRVQDLQIEKRQPEPILLGRHLIDMGLQPSPGFKEILDAVYELQLDGKISDIDAAKKAAAKIKG